MNAKTLAQQGKNVQNLISFKTSLFRTFVFRLNLDPKYIRSPTYFDLGTGKGDPRKRCVSCFTRANDQLGTDYHTPWLTLMVAPPGRLQSAHQLRDLVVNVPSTISLACNRHRVARRDALWAKPVLGLNWPWMNTASCKVRLGVDKRQEFLVGSAPICPAYCSQITYGCPTISS